MKKILLASNVGQPDRDAMDFACYLSKLVRTRLAGVFVPAGDVDPVANPSRNLQSAYSSMIAQSLYHFKESCTCRETSYFIPRQHIVDIGALIEETRFCDLMILPAHLTLGKHISPATNSFTRKILTGAQCPVAIAPGTFERVDKIVFTYDGSKGSVYAMRQFTSLFPEFRKTPIIILTVNANKDTSKGEISLKEWLDCHYDKVQHNFLEGNTADQLIRYLSPRRHAFVVMGAYGHRSLIHLLKGSTADPVTETLFNPLFFAHS
jgi:hypothetical protein